MNRTEIVAVAWVALRERRLLVARARGQDAFYLPGGKPEPGETFAEAAARETLEETGVHLDPADLVHYADFHAPAHGRGPDTDVRLVCFTVPNAAEPNAAEANAAGASAAEPVASSEIEELGWFGTADADACAPAVRLLLARLSSDNLID